MDKDLYEIKVIRSNDIDINIVTGISDADRFDNNYVKAGNKVMFSVSLLKDIPGVVMIIKAANGEHVPLSTNKFGDKFHGFFTMPNCAVEICVWDTTRVLQCCNSNDGLVLCTQTTELEDTCKGDADTSMKKDDEVEVNNSGVIDYFTIPDELAKELSNLLMKQTVRERLISQLINDPDGYEKVEEMLIPITTKIEEIKAKITKEFVPNKYKSIEYVWNYDGYSIDGNKVQIIRGAVNK